LLLFTASIPTHPTSLMKLTASFLLPAVPIIIHIRLPPWRKSLGVDRRHRDTSTLAKKKRASSSSSSTPCTFCHLSPQRESTNRQDYQGRHPLGSVIYRIPSEYLTFSLHLWSDLLTNVIYECIHHTLTVVVVHLSIEV